MVRPLTRLTDEQLAYIATAPADMSATQIARDLDVPYSTAVRNVKRIGADGWLCHLHWRTCTVCSCPVCSSNGTRTAHPECEVERDLEQDKRRRQRPGHIKSTEAIRNWLARHPKAVERHRKAAREYERRKKTSKEAGILVRAGLSKAARLVVAREILRKRPACSTKVLADALGVTRRSAERYVKEVRLLQRLLPLARQRAMSLIRESQK